jgi:hypothetical protein
MFKIRVLRRIFGPKREELAGGWRRLVNEELHNLYASPYIIRVIKSRRLICVVDITHMEEIRNAYKLVRKPERRDNSEALGIGGRIILKWIIEKHRWKVVDWIHLAQDMHQLWALINKVVNLQVP